MITAIEIENLRGIREGALHKLAPLTILTGPNACGKSTVLDALLVATSLDPLEATGHVVQRRPTVRGGARWLVGASRKKATVVASTAVGKWIRGLQWFDRCSEDLADALHERQVSRPYSTILVQEEQYADGAMSGAIGFGLGNEYVAHPIGGDGLSQLPYVCLVDPGLPIELEQSFSAVTRSGRRKQVYELIGSLVPGFEELTILVEDDGTPRLYVTSDGRSVPVGLAGDGVQAFVQLALEIAVAPDGLVLIEEPEVYQHPATLRQTAGLLLANVRRGVQIVMTTHSLELIDAIVSEAGDAQRDQLALYNLALRDGVLSSGRRSGEDMTFARQTLENDLR